MDKVNYWTVPGIKQSIVKELTDEEKTKIIQKVIKKVTTFTVKDLIPDVRKKDWVNARYLSYYFLRKYTKLSYEAIGDMYGKDHTTVMNGFGNIQRWIEIGDPSITPLYEDIDDKLKRTI